MDDLDAALEAGQLGAAGLDVTVPEPLPTSHPLFRRPNCTILPHIGSATRQTRDLMASTTVQNLCNALQGLPMLAAVLE